MLLALLISLLILISACSKPQKEYEKIEPNGEGIYVQDEHCFSYLYPIDEKSITDLGEKINNICSSYLTANNKIYYSLIPDKSYFSHTDEKIDYKQMEKLLKESVKQGKYIEIGSLLSLEDFYNTDGHWKQERLFPLVNALGKEMGFSISEKDYEKKSFDDYHGMYYEISGREFPFETLIYMTNDEIENAKTDNFQDKEFKGVYNENLLKSKTPYDVFLSGPTPLITITNDKAEGNKELIVFRDSFMSSLAPLMIEAYSKITLVDLRYMMNTMLPQFIEFNDQDVLFMYSEAVANKSIMIK